MRMLLPLGFMIFSALALTWVIWYPCERIKNESAKILVRGLVLFVGVILVCTTIAVLWGKEISVWLNGR